MVLISQWMLEVNKTMPSKSTEKLVSNLQDYNQTIYQAYGYNEYSFQTWKFNTQAPFLRNLLKKAPVQNNRVN